MQALRSYADIGLIVTVALAIRVAFFQPVHTIGYTSDEKEYITMAGRLAEGGEYVDSNGEHSTRAPLFPYLLASLLLVGGGSVSTAHLVGCMLGAIVVFVGFLLSLEVWNDRYAALFVAGIIAVYPGLVIYAGVLQTETLYTCLLLLALWLASRATRHPTLWTMAALGAIGGLAALTRAVFLGFFPVLLAGIWWLVRKETDRSVGLVMVSVLVFCVVLAPWTIRNYSLFKAFVPVSSGGGNSLLTGNNPYATGTWRLEPGFEQWFASRAQELGVRDVNALNEVQKSAVSGRIAREYMAAHPLETLSLMAKKAHIFAVYPITNTDSPGMVQVVAVLFDVLLLIGALAGFAACVRTPGRPWALYAALGFFSFVQLFLHAEARFRLPLVPVISLFAGIGISSFVDANTRKDLLAIVRARRLLVGGGLVLVVVYGITGFFVLQGTL